MALRERTPTRQRADFDAYRTILYIDLRAEELTNRPAVRAPKGESSSQLIGSRAARQRFPREGQPDHTDRGDR